MTQTAEYAEIIPLDGHFKSTRICAVADAGRASISVLRFPPGLAPRWLDAAMPELYSVPREMFGRQYEPLGIRMGGLGHHFDDAANPPPPEIADSKLPLFSPRIAAVHAVLKGGRVPQGFERLHAQLGWPLTFNAGDTVVSFAGGTAIMEKSATIFNQHISLG